MKKVYVIFDNYCSSYYKHSSHVTPGHGWCTDVRWATFFDTHDEAETLIQSGKLYLDEDCIIEIKEVYIKQTS